MLVHYYTVKNCKFEMYEGKPAIFASEEADEDSPTIKFNFFQTVDGRWCHYLTQEEYYYIMSFPSDAEVTFGKRLKPPNPLSAKEKRYANIMCLISLGLLICGIIILLCTGSQIAIHSWVASLILMIAVRVKYTESLFGKILMISYIVLAVIAVVLLIFAIASTFTNSFLDSLLTCPVPK